MKITELFSLEDLELELQAGYVKEQKHPTLPLTILNYTDKTTYEQRWNNVTTHCRGLIVDRTTDEVIARGPRKFFNYGEPSAPDYPLSTSVLVTRKEDGSLGIGWYYIDEENEDCHWGIATRGSFTSEQAAHATQLVKENSGHDGHYEIMPDSLDYYHDCQISYIGEIVYPDNRIVLDYGEQDAVLPLGTVNNLSGVIEWRPWGYNGRDAEVMMLGDALALPIPDDEEGYVLDILDDLTGNTIDHLKLKGDKYKELHSAIFGLTERKIYDAWVDGREATLIEELPDELQPWALQVAQRFDAEWEDLMDKVRAVFEALTYAPRKEQAQHILTNHKDISPALFALLDGNTEKCHAWVDKQIKPGHVPFKIIKENAVV